MKLTSLLVFTVFAVVAPASADVSLTCVDGKNYEEGRRLEAGDFHCSSHQGLDGVAIVKEVGRNTAEVRDNPFPTCSQGASCKDFVLRLPDGFGSLKVVELNAHEGTTASQKCFNATVTKTGDRYAVSPIRGTCSIGYSGWADVTLNRTSGSVEGQFRNWADHRRWGVLWLWYEPRN